MSICKCCGQAIVAPVRNSQCEPCPRCGEYTVLQFPSMSKKICTNCHTVFDWKLKPKQKSVLIEGLVGSDEYDE